MKRNINETRIWIEQIFRIRAFLVEESLSTRALRLKQAQLIGLIAKSDYGYSTGGRRGRSSERWPRARLCRILRDHSKNFIFFLSRN